MKTEHSDVLIKNEYRKDTYLSFSSFFREFLVCLIPIEDLSDMRQSNC